MRKIDNTNPPLTMTVGQAVVFTGYSRSSIYLRLTDGRLPYKKEGRSVKILTVDLVKMVNER